MSTCISARGEYSSHEPDGDYVCTFCGVLDEDALIAELNQLRALVTEGAAVAREQADWADRFRAERDALRAGIAEMIKRAERSAGFVRQSRAWGHRTDRVAGIYARGAERLRSILASAAPK